MSICVNSAPNDRRLFGDILYWPDLNYNFEPWSLIIYWFLETNTHTISQFKIRKNLTNLILHFIQLDAVLLKTIVFKYIYLKFNIIQTLERIEQIKIKTFFLYNWSFFFRSLVNNVSFDWNQSKWIWKIRFSRFNLLIPRTPDSRREDCKNIVVKSNWL